MSLLKVERFIHKADWTISRVYLDGKLFCFAIEDEKRTTKVKGETCIPDGTYKLSTRWSPKFSPIYNHEMIWVKDVPNFEYILVHWGNTDDDTDGCLIVGSKIGIVKGQDAVLSSRDTYLKLYSKVIERIQKGNEYIEYVSI
jgi:hypothetical protein